MTKKFGWTKNILIHQIENQSYKKYLTNQTNFDQTLPEYAGKMQFYLSVLNDKIKLEDENPSIGIIICKEKNRLIVDYALKDTSQPIGVAEYKITKRLPKALRGFLPSTSELKDKFKELDL